MAFPTGTIDTVTSDLTGGSTPAIAVGANLYTVILGTGLNRLVMFKSLDAGVTWNVVGGLGPQINDPGGFALVLVAGTTLITFANEPGSNFIVAKTFSTTTDTWVTEIVSTIPGLTTTFGYTAFVRPSDGAVIVAYCQPVVAAGNLLRTFITIFNGSFSAPIATGTTNNADPNDWVQCSITIGAGTEIEMLLWFGPISTSVSTVQGMTRQPLNGSTVGALQNILTDATPGAANNIPGASCDGVTYVAMFANDTNPTQVTVCVAPVSTFVFTNTNLNSTGTHCVCAVPFQGPYGTVLLIGGDDGGLGTVQYYLNSLVTPTFLGMWPNTPGTVDPTNSQQLSATLVGFIWQDQLAPAIFFASILPAAPPPVNVATATSINATNLPNIPMGQKLRDCAQPKKDGCHGFSNKCY